MTINPGRKKKPAGKKITKNIKDNSPPLVDATGDDGDEHNAGDHDGGIKGNDSDNGLDVTCYDGDRFKAGDNSIKGNDACVDVTLDNRDMVISGNDGISINGEGVNSGDNNNNYGNEGNVGYDVDEVNDGNIGNDGDNRFACTSVLTVMGQWMSLRGGFDVSWQSVVVV